MTSAQPDAPHVPALPSGSNTTTTTATTTATTLSGVESKQQPGDDSATPPLGRHVEQTHQPNHVDSSTPSPKDPDLGKQQQNDIPTFDVITQNDAKTEDQQQPCPSATTTTLESNIKSCSTGQQQPPPEDQQHSSTPTTNNNSSKAMTSTTNAAKSIKSTKSASSLKKSSNQSLSQIPKETKSRLRQPSRTNSTATTGSTHSATATPSASSSSSSLQQKDSATSRLTTATSTPPPPMPSLIPTNLNGASTDQKDQLIQQLQEALQTEQSINRVLQGQKEAITRDLDYFSLTVDELMEEKESLVQKYEEEKLKSQSKEEDLNVLLEKLKTSTDNARDRSMEVDQWKTEIENIKEEISLEQNELKSVLKRKDQEIVRLKNELVSAKEEVNALSSRLDMLLQETTTHHKPSTNGSHSPSSNHHHHHSIATGAIETPSASPRLDAQHYMDHDENSPMPVEESTLPTRTINDSTLGNKKRVHHPSLSVSTAPPPSHHPLDDELMSLTKEKERLQSDYGKIPLSGGGPTSRRRKEQLEEMLDEVDSQLSKVKQKIRRS
ncbi:unnamed protein product [Absidia cylindrospora]